jgi:NAD(P)-dependent dehydrogenase (short-subunit alcohol dehydrogenase family)
MSNVWLITGSSRGLGREVAEAVLAHGGRLVATARQPEQLAELVERHGDAVRTVALDVTDADAVRAAVEEAVAAFGRLDVVVNNAGYADVEAVEDVEDDSFRAQFEANFFGMVNVTKAVLPVMREQGSGHIVQISSVMGRMTIPGLAAYQSAKYATAGFSETLAQEIGPLGIAVTIVEPGPMRTEWAGDSMASPQPSAPYVATVGTVIERLRAGSGGQSVDPGRVARAIVELVELEGPPLHLLLGSEAIMYATGNNDALRASDERWRALTLTADYPAA